MAAEPTRSDRRARPLGSAAMTPRHPHPGRRRTVGLSALALTVATLVAACGDSSSNTTTATTTSPAPTTTDATTTPGSPTTTAPATTAVPTTVVAKQTIAVSYVGGTLTGGGRKTVVKGSVVTLQVTTDRTDEVHLHGYDIKVDTAPGAVAELTFTATIPGVFEVELEKKGVKLLELEVR